MHSDNATVSYHKKLLSALEVITLAQYNSLLYSLQLAALRDEITAKQQQIEELTDENQKRAVTEEQLKCDHEKLKAEVAEKVCGCQAQSSVFTKKCGMRVSQDSVH